MINLYYLSKKWKKMKKMKKLNLFFIINYYTTPLIMDPTMQSEILHTIKYYQETKNLIIFKMLLDRLNIDKDLQAQIIKSALEIIGV